MKSVPVIAIFDIGKTNKKFFLIDEHYKIVLERTVNFDETVDDDGDPCEDIALLTNWVKESLQEILELKKFDVKALNFSTYGASFVHLDQDGVVTAPLCNYLKSFPDELKDEFLCQIRRRDSSIQPNRITCIGQPQFGYAIISHQA